MFNDYSDQLSECYTTYAETEVQTVDVDFQIWMESLRNFFWSRLWEFQTSLISKTSHYGYFSPLNSEMLTVTSTAPYVLMREKNRLLLYMGLVKLNYWSDYDLTEDVWWILYGKLKKLIVLLNTKQRPLLNVLCEVQFLVCTWHFLNWKESNLQAVSFVLPCCSHARTLSI